MTDRYPSPRALLEKHGLRAKRSWGQNFLGDAGILDEIARLAAPEEGTLVVELGAGLGHLTARLVARGARVVAVERDRDMARVLRAELGERITLLEADAARLDYGLVAREQGGGSIEERAPSPQPSPPEGERGRYSATASSPSTSTATPTSAERATSHPPSPPARAGGEGWGRGGSRETATSTSTATPTSTATATSAERPGGEGWGRGGARRPATKLAVVGNLPYHLTSPILFSLLDQVEHLSRAVLLVQREVAERLAASPGTHAWGILSVLLQREAEVSIERIVPPGAFLPPPKVESAVVCALFRPPADPVADPVRFRRLVKAGFAQRRKTLANALRAGRVGDEGALEAALAAAGVDPRRRGETLTVAEWAALDRALG